MRARSTVILAMLAVAVATSSASAQEVTEASETLLNSGTLEFTPSLSFNRSTFSAGGAGSSSNTHLNFDAAVGRCMSERFEMAASFLAQHQALGGEGRNAFGGSASAIVNFKQQGNVIPFASGGVGYLTSSTDSRKENMLLVPMVRAGFRTMIGEERSLNVSVGFQHEKSTESAIDASSDVFEVGVGLSVFRPNSK